MNPGFWAPSNTWNLRSLSRNNLNPSNIPGTLPHRFKLFSLWRSFLFSFLLDKFSVHTCSTKRIHGIYGISTPPNRSGEKNKRKWVSIASAQQNWAFHHIGTTWIYEVTVMNPIAEGRTTMVLKCSSKKCLKSDLAADFVAIAALSFFVHKFCFPGWHFVVRRGTTFSGRGYFGCWRVLLSEVQKSGEPMQGWL